MELSALSLQVRGLSVLRGLQQHPLVHAYLDVFDALGQNADAFADRYGALCAAQFACPRLPCWTPPRMISRRSAPCSRWTVRRSNRLRRPA